MFPPKKKVEVLSDGKLLTATATSRFNGEAGSISIQNSFRNNGNPGIPDRPRAASVWITRTM